MRTNTVLATLLPLLVIASPVAKRAGGPTAEPIPSNCTVINPLPHAACGTANVNGWMPDPNFTNQSLLYESYFDSFLSQAEQAKQCRQQCYGYGEGECRTSFVGYQIPVPEGYMGSSGGQLETGCLLFSNYMDPNVFVKASKGQYLNATATNIYCPG